MANAIARPPSRHIAPIDIGRDRGPDPSSGGSRALMDRWSPVPPPMPFGPNGWTRLAMGTAQAWRRAISVVLRKLVAPALVTLGGSSNRWNRSRPPLLRPRQLLSHLAVLLCLCVEPLRFSCSCPPPEATGSPVSDPWAPHWRGCAARLGNRLPALSLPRDGGTIWLSRFVFAWSRYGSHVAALLPKRPAVRSPIRGLRTGVGAPHGSETGSRRLVYC